MRCASGLNKSTYKFYHNFGVLAQLVWPTPRAPAEPPLSTDEPRLAARMEKFRAAQVDQAEQREKGEVADVFDWFLPITSWNSCASSTPKGTAQK